MLRATSAKSATWRLSRTFVLRDLVPPGVVTYFNDFLNIVRCNLGCELLQHVLAPFVQIPVTRLEQVPHPVLVCPGEISPIVALEVPADQISRLKSYFLVRRARLALTEQLRHFRIFCGKKPPRGLHYHLHTLRRLLLLSEDEVDPGGVRVKLPHAVQHKLEIGHIAHAIGIIRSEERRLG